MAEELIAYCPLYLGGKPCVRGTRLSVEFLLELAASGATREQILAEYPQLTAEGLAAAFDPKPGTNYDGQSSLRNGVFKPRGAVDLEEHIDVEVLIPERSSPDAGDPPGGRRRSR